MNESLEITSANEETRGAWNANASYWDEKMGEGNDFFNVLLWPAILPLLEPHQNHKILDIATGNGLTARRLAALGVGVTAFDFSSELIQLAIKRPSAGSPISYHVLDATDETALLKTLSPTGPFDSALCNMALFDMAEIAPLFRTLPRLLKPGGIFVFSLMHPAFNNSSVVHLGEEHDDQGVIKTVYSVKISKYITSSTSHGLAIRGQPKPQLYFDRPMQDYLNLGFQNGFVLDGFEERAFPPGHPQKNLLGWGGSFSEIPPVLVVRMRLTRS